MVATAPKTTHVLDDSNADATIWRRRIMRKINNSLTLATCATIMLGGSGVAWSDQEEQKNQDSPWDMSPTAAPFITPDNSISIGVGYLGGDRQKLGMFDGQDGSSGRLLLDTKIIKRDDNTGTWSFAEGRNLGLNDNLDVNLELERQGKWGIGVGYKETPRIAPYTINSETNGLGTILQNISIAVNPGSGTTHEIGTEVDRLTIDAFSFLSHNIKLNVSFRNETKEGTKQWGVLSSASIPAFVLEPVDWTTRQLETNLSYVSDNLQLLGGYNGTWFGNKNTLVDSIYQGADSNTLANHVYLSLPLDNEAHEFFLSGGYNFSPLTRVAFKISHTRALQNEHMATTDIAGLSLDTAPTNLEGQVDSILVSLELTARPIFKLSLMTKLRYNDENDQTPAWLVSTNKRNIHSTPISNRTILGTVEGTYRLPYQVTLTGGVEYKDQKRDVPLGDDVDNDGLDEERFVPWRTDLDEATYKLRLRRNLSETINGSVRYEHGIRKGSQYVDSIKILGNEQGKIHPVFIADRDRDKLRLSVDWRPIERLGIQLNAENAWDRYDQEQTPYGRKKGQFQLYSMDMDYAPTDKWLFTAWYSHDINKTWHETGRWSNAGVQEVEKRSKPEDIGNALGLGVRSQWNYKLKLGANFDWSRSESSYQDDIQLLSGNTIYPTKDGGVTSLPDITSTTTRFNTFVEYKGLGPGTLRGDFIYEHWRTDDWTWQFSDGSPYVYGTDTDSSMISTKDSQSANFFGVRYTVKFQ